MFNKGQTVYDQVYYPNLKGEVIEVKGSGNYPVVVKFTGNFKADYTLDGRANNYQMPTLSEVPYGVHLVGFEQAGISDSKRVVNKLANVVKKYSAAYV